mmetsp:Transcript_62936/g.73240  ORF Transcript_62936/g.73240 Transcript_62936/m.73240 type:complete len:273 (-) Transcript_62936:326-1144(-)
MSRNLNTLIVEIPATERSNLESLKGDSKTLNGRWTKEEHQRFVDAIKIHGKNWKKVEEYVGSRNGAQVRSHAQKYFLKLEKELKVKSKGRLDRETVQTVRKLSGESDSTAENQDNLSDSGKAEETLKDNLPFNEIYENITEASENTKLLNSNVESPLLDARKGAQFPKASPGKTRLQEATNNILAMSSLTNKINTNIPNSSAFSTPQKDALAQNLLHHHSVFLDLMNYFTKFNKTAASLKLSDFVDLSNKSSTEDDENCYEFPVGGKKVKKY